MRCDDIVEALLVGNPYSRDDCLDAATINPIDDDLVRPTEQLEEINAPRGIDA